MQIYGIIFPFRYGQPRDSSLATPTRSTVVPADNIWWGLASLSELLLTSIRVLYQPLASRYGAPTADLSLAPQMSTISDKKNLQNKEKND